MVSETGTKAKHSRAYCILAFLFDIQALGFTGTHETPLPFASDCDCTLMHTKRFKVLFTCQEPAFFAPPQTHSLYSVSSEEEEVQSSRALTQMYALDEVNHGNIHSTKEEFVRYGCR